jgi:hypothetical protein
MTSTEAGRSGMEELAGKLTEAQRSILLDASAADCHEWWLLEDIGEPSLAGADLVLTDLGVAVMRYLEAGHD